MKPSPQSATFRAGGYPVQKRPERVPEWVIGIGIILFFVAGLGAAVALATSAMRK